MKLVKIKKGFTLIEVMVTISILFIIIGIVSAIFNYNLNLLYNTENKNDLQREAQYAMSYFSRSSMEAQNVAFLRNESGDDILGNTVNNGSPINISEIEFSTGNSDATYGGTISYNFKLNNGILTYTKKIINTTSGDIISQTSSDIASNIQSIAIKPSTNGITFRGAIGLSITINLSKSSQIYSITSNVYFRNNNNQ